MAEKAANMECVNVIGFEIIGKAAHTNPQQQSPA